MEIDITTLSQGGLVDRLYSLQNRQRVCNRVVDRLKKQEQDVKDRLLELLQTYSVTGVSSSHGTASLKKEIIPTVNDWETFYQYIIDNDAFDLLQRRPNSLAFRCRWESGEDVPGVSKYEKSSVLFRRK